MAKKPEITPQNYSKLLSELRVLIEECQQKVQIAVARVMAENYWLLGERIAILTPNPDDLAPTLDLLSQDLKLERSQLQRFVKFYRLWPESPPTAAFDHVTWSHFKVLLGIEDQAKREFYLQQAQLNAWPVRQLSQTIKAGMFEKIQRDPLPADNPVLTRGHEALHIYKTRVDHVVDGDTLVVNIDLGFDVWVKKRLRLRGIDTPEMRSDDADEARRALAAKIFVEERLPVDSVVVAQTFMVDLHGRFVADVFYLPGETDKETVFAEGRFLNQELLDEGLARLEV